MRFRIVAAGLVMAWAAGVTMTARGQQAPPTSTWSGVFTEDQATKGATSYAKQCSECHLEDMAGDGFAPALKGPEFMNNWNGLSVGDLYERVRVSMPPNNPAAVPNQEKVDIVSHILKANGFPAGTTELAAQAEALKAIKFEATKPGQ